MVEQDYIMRLIREMVRTVLKLLLNIDINEQAENIVTDKNQQNALNELLDMIDNGKINEAENKIFELTSENDTQSLKTAMLFYLRLNDKSDDFLEENNFSREEIISGIKELAAQYGLADITDIFTQNYPL